MPDFPKRLHLPSGRVLQIATSQPTGSHAQSGLFGGALRLFEDGFRLADDKGIAIPVGSLALADFHTLRAVAHRTGLLAESAVSIPCRNCEKSFEARPSEALELGPFIDGELSCEELDAPFPFGEPRPIPEMEIDGRYVETVTLMGRTVNDALPLWEKIARASWEFDADIVRAMGIQALGDERRPEVIAAALSEITEEALGAILSYFDEAHYPLRLRVRVACPECKAIDYADAPVEREFPADATADEAASEEPFLELDAFEIKVRVIADEVYAQRGVTQAVNLLVCADVPAVDDGGVPLLGSYVPEGADPGTGVMRSPEITLYYRTFRAMWEEEGPYDVEGELRETIDHELEHHLHHIEGHDPLDDDERALIEDEHIRLIGRRESVRRARAGFIADVSEFWRRTWPLWVLVALLTVVATLAER